MCSIDQQFADRQDNSCRTHLDVTPLEQGEGVGTLPNPGRAVRLKSATIQKSLEQLGSEYMDNNFFQSKRIPTEVVSAKGLYRRRLNFDFLRELQDDMKVDVVGQ